MKNFLTSKVLWAFGSQGLIAIFSIIFAKLVALYISPENFGVYNLQFAILAFGNSLLINPLIQSFKSKWKQNNADEVIRFHGNLILLIHFVVVILGILSWILMSSISLSLIIFLAVFWFCQSIFTLERDYLNITDNQKEYAILALLAAFLPILTIIGLIKINFNESIAVWLAQFSAFVIPIILVFGVLSKQRLKFGHDFFRFVARLKNYKAQFITLISFSSPLIILAIFSWFSNYSDKYLISYYLDNQEVGLYSAAYGLATKLILTLNAPFVLLLNPIVLKYKNDFRLEDHLGINKTILKYVSIYFLIGIISISLLFFLKDFVGLLFLSEKYQNAFILMPYLSVSYLFLTICHLIETKFYAYGSTRFILYHNIIAAVINVLMNIYLVPKFGILGSAYAMIFTTLAQLLFCLTFIKKI